MTLFEQITPQTLSKCRDKKSNIPVLVFARIKKDKLCFDVDNIYEELEE